MKRLRLKSKQRKRSSVAVSTDPVPHDRRGMTELPKNAKVAPVVVDDPYALEPGAKIIAFRNIETDPLGWLRSHKKQDGTLYITSAQYEGGRKWQHYYEVLEGGIRSLDPAKEAVDGGQIHDPYTDEKRKAAKFLTAAREGLGVEGDLIVRDCLVSRMLPGEIALKRGKTTQRDKDYFSRRLIECLEQLAILGGFAMPASNGG